MPKSFNVTAGHWWRFSGYEITDGLIRPRPKAKLKSYDPWAAFWSSRAPNGPQPPYLALVNLVKGLNFVPRPGPGPFRELKADSAAALVDWCEQYGLLGLLSHQSVMAWLAPTKEPEPNNESVIVPTQIQFARTGEGWTTFGQPRYNLKYGPLSRQPERRGELLPMDKTSGDWPEPGVLTQPLGEEIYHHEGFGPAWHRFFPGVSGNVVETHPYPAPLSDPFWEAYAEPVEDVVKAVVQLRKALTLLKDATEAGSQDLGRIQRGMDILHALTRTIRPTLVSSDGILRQEWLSTSLLGTLAMMVLLDLTENRRILTCETCGKIYPTKAYQARYCTDTCRFTAQKRRHRGRQKATPNRPGRARSSSPKNR